MKTIQVNDPFFHYVYIGTATEKAGIAAPGIDDEFIETDTGIQYRWDGIAWAVTNSSGAHPVTFITSSGIFGPASADFNAAVAADVDAAVAAATGLRLMGYSSIESALVPAVARLRIIHGATAAGGVPIIDISLLAGGAANEWLGPDGIAIPNGLSIDQVSGTFDISLFYKVV